MPTEPTTADVLADFTRRGFALRAAAGRLVVTPASALTAGDRDLIRARRDELLVALLPAQPWDAAVAFRLMFDADTSVERLGVSGRDPAISGAAGRVVDAHRRHDMLALRLAVREFETVVRQVHSDAKAIDARPPKA